jgi:hypothetical protein
MAIGLVALFLTAVVGCKDKASVATGGKSLTLTAPSDVTLARGGMASITVTLTRTNFADPVKVKFENLPAGVRVAEAAGVDLKAGPISIDIGHEPPAIQGDKAIYTLKADDDAALVSGSQVQLSADGPDGKPVTVSFKITVKAKD